jgi:hypothetical protein
MEFEPKETWMYYLWHAPRGVNVDEHPPLTKHWNDLLNEAGRYSEARLPERLKKDPGLMLLFLLVYPHRATCNTIKRPDQVLRGDF